MSCEKFKLTMMAYLDKELSEEERALFEEHLETCESCRKELASFQGLERELAEMTFADPTDQELEQYWRSVYNRLERGAGWIFLSIGVIFLLSYGAFVLIEDFIRSNEVAMALKIGVVSLIFGLVVLLVSLVRERLALCAKDRYSRDVKR
jgi:predicted anti-sigma-YlaC factor YlaD